MTLVRIVLKTLAKSVLIPLEVTAAASATDAAIHKEMFGSVVTTLIILNEEINDILKIDKCLAESGLLIKSVSQTIKNEAKEQKREFLSMLLSTLSASLLGNLLTHKSAIKAGKGTIRVGKEGFLMPPHP